MERRKFFKSIVQGGIFSALAGMSAYLFLREEKSGHSTCSFDFVCQNCKKGSYCKLPEASKFRLNNRLNK